MKPKGRLKLYDVIREYMGIKSGLYIYTDSKKRKFLFKEMDKEGIGNELAAYELGKLFGLRVVESRFKKINKRTGIIQPFKKFPDLSKIKLNKKQKTQLQRIVLFDIWIGNKERNQEDILADKNLYAVNHDKIFHKSEKGSEFIDYSIGKKLDPDFVDKMSRFVLDIKSPTVKELLTEKLSFNRKHFIELKRIKKEDIEKAVQNKFLSKKDQKKKYLIRRKNNLEDFRFFG